MMRTLAIHRNASADKHPITQSLIEQKLCTENNELNLCNILGHMVHVRWHAEGKLMIDHRTNRWLIHRQCPVSNQRCKNRSHLGVAFQSKFNCRRANCDHKTHRNEPSKSDTKFIMRET